MDEAYVHGKERRMKKYNFSKKIEMLTAILVLGVVFVFACINAPALVKNINAAKEDQGNELLPDYIKSIEKGYKNDFYMKNEFVDAYGLIQKRLGKYIISGMSYVKDDNGVMHKFSAEKTNVKQFRKDLEYLKTVLDVRGIPLVYIQAANREVLCPNPDIDDMIYDNTTTDEIVSEISEVGIDMVDMRRVFVESGYPVDKVFFNSDIHMTTDAELFQARTIATYLEANYGINFADEQYLYDMECYDKKTYSFVGNLSRDVGKCNEIIDEFDMYFPKFQTDLTIEDNVGDTIFRGAFQDVIMHGLEKNNPTKYTYWITNYLWFGAPYYTITNHLHETDGPKILFITDSLGYRTISHLALASGEVTILDPRYYMDVDLTSLALRKNYDAVVVLQQSRLCNFELFPE